jgi:Zn-finger nucleic acid-binding protein
MTQRDSVEIDYCPECRGVWLDRGELDKIIERNAPLRQINGSKVENSDSSGYPLGEGNGYRKKKRDSFLGDLFDF